MILKFHVYNVVLQYTNNAMVGGGYTDQSKLGVTKVHAHVIGVTRGGGVQVPGK